MRADHTTNNPLTYCTRVRVRVQAVHVRKYFRTALKYLFPDVFYVFISGSTKVRKYESTKVRKYESTSLLLYVYDSCVHTVRRTFVGIRVRV